MCVAVMISSSFLPTKKAKVSMWHPFLVDRLFTLCSRNDVITSCGIMYFISGLFLFDEKEVNSGHFQSELTMS